MTSKWQITPEKPNARPTVNGATMAVGGDSCSQKIWRMCACFDQRRANAAHRIRNANGNDVCDRKRGTTMV
jgi:hypothetical protein